MALRKPLFMSADGYSEEMAAADSIELGALTMSGNIAMGGNKVTGLAAATASGEALVYGQSGAMLNGLNVNSQLITNVLTPSAGTDAANKNYVDAVAAGLDWKPSVRAIATANITLSGTQTIDGVALIVGERVLVTGQSTASQNGIYVVAAGAWSRASDLAAASSAAGAAVFVEEGTAFADTGWVCTSDVGADIVATNDLAFTQFTGTGSIIAGTGLTKTGNTIDAIGGAGIVANADDLAIDLHTAADAQGAGTGGGSSGLEFDASGLAGKLRAAVNATGGLERTASGLAVKMDDTPDTLDSGAAGLKVVGLPSLFKVNGTAVGATVTAANLDTLTNASNADALHSHASTGRIENVILSNEAITANDPVVWSGTANQVNQARANTDARSLVMGVSKTSAGGSGVSLNVVSHGVATGVLTGATPGAAYYLGATGGLTATVPGGGNRVIQCGIAKTGTDLWVRIIDYGKKAA